MLKCNISIDVNHLTEGIRLGLKEDREKTSQQLGRCVHTGHVRGRGRVGCGGGVRDRVGCQQGGLSGVRVS